MVKKLLNIVAIVLALYVGAVGSGVNISHYCCHECRLHHECLCHHHHSENCDTEIESGSHCGVIHIDAPASYAPDHLHLIPLVAQCTLPEACRLSDQAARRLVRATILSCAPPVRSGRDTLLSTSSLLI